MPVIGFNTSGTELDQFVRFGYELYRDDPRWIPPSEESSRRLLCGQCALWQRPGNGYRCFSASADGRIVARAAAGVNRALADRDGRPVGTIGFFESVNDPCAATETLHAACEWFRAQGITRVWAPMNFDIWHGYRCMTAGFGRTPFWGEPFNKPYYPELLERAGFSVTAEWDTAEVNGREVLREMTTRGNARRVLLESRGYYFRNFDPARWSSEIKNLTNIINRSFAGFLGFTEVSACELSALLSAARPAIRPELFIFAYDGDDCLVGFAAAFLELGEAIRSMHGRCDWSARLRFLLNRRKSDTINFLLGGVAPEEIERRSGLGRAGFAWILQAVLNAGYDKVLLAMRLKGNAAHGLAAHGAPIAQREYALFGADV